MKIARKIILRFPKGTVEKPVVCRWVKDFDLEFNILKAAVTPNEEGLMHLEIKGEKDKYNKGLEYLTSEGVKVQQISQEIKRDEARCTHCGICVSVCPTPSLAIDKKTREVIFDSKHCVACEMCVRVCPVKAMEIKF